MEGETLEGLKEDDRASMMSLKTNPGGLILSNTEQEENSDAVNDEDDKDDNGFDDNCDAKMTVMIEMKKVMVIRRREYKRSR
jgi:hypothetical protein